MLKIVCTVAFLIITLSSWVCIEAKPTSTSNDNKEHLWKTPCGNPDNYNVSSILQGKEQKIKLYKSFHRAIIGYGNKLNNTVKRIEIGYNLSQFGILENPFPKFTNRSMKAIHRDLQIYIGVFNRLYELQKDENRMENEKSDILDQLKELREKTRELLCFMEDMLNGTDSMRIRVKYISDSVMKKKVNTIETQSLHMDIQRALTSVKSFVTELEKFIDKRIGVLESHKKNINPTKCKKMRKCSKRLRMKERMKKNQERKHRRHHSRGARIRSSHIGKA